jgi:hypothetical protein
LYPSAANVSDLHMPHDLLHGGEKGMGRCRVSRSNRGDAQSRALGVGHDQPPGDD